MIYKKCLVCSKNYRNINGKKKAIGNYNANLASESYLDSIWRIKIRENIRVGGIKDGICKEFNEKGKLIKKEKYKNGELIEQKKIKLKKK